MRRSGPLTHDLVLAPGAFGLGRIPARLAPDATANLVCGFCSTGCGLTVHLRDGAPVNLSPAAGYPVNRGAACPKGWEALAPLAATDRATVPLWRTGKRREAIDWPTALATFTARMKAIQARHGAHAVAFLGSGQLVTEEQAFLGAFAKFGMGLLHGDGNTRQCMATAVVAYKETFGFDAPPYTYRDLEESDVIVLVGSNLCIAHPILWERICRNPHAPAIVVVDPRKTETAMAATQHLAPRPKSDLTLLYGVARALIQRGWIDAAYLAAHTAGFEAYAAHVAAFTPEVVAAATGVAPEQLEALAATIHRGRRVSFWWTMGVNQSHEGVRVAQALIALALMTGNMGRPGTGANSITGQCNAMGSRLFSNTTNLLGGHDFANPAHRDKVAGVLGIDAARVPDRTGLAYDQILEGILARKIRGLWIVGTNPAHSWINQRDLHDVLGRLDFLVVQDMYASTETAERAHLLLPAAGWGEKEGTFINSERRLGVVRRVARAPGQALADFHIFQLLAEAWGASELFERWRTPEDVFRLLVELTRGQPCDITGIDGYAQLDEHGGIQWPFAAATTAGGAGGARSGSARRGGDAERSPIVERRLFEDGRYYHADGRARFCFEAPRPLPEATSPAFPLTLLTGRGSSSQWHTQTRTAKSAVLRRLAPKEIYLELSPVDAKRIGVAPNDWVIVESQRGDLRARAFVTNAVRPGEVFLPMHYGTTNRLTFPAFDPYSRQPAYKACAVNVRRLLTSDRAP